MPVPVLCWRCAMRRRDIISSAGHDLSTVRRWSILRWQYRQASCGQGRTTGPAYEYGYFVRTYVRTYVHRTYSPALAFPAASR